MIAFNLLLAASHFALATTPSKPQIEISIAVPLYGVATDPDRHEREIGRLGERFFTVVFKNLTNKPMDLYTDENSFGEQTLSFEIQEGARKWKLHSRRNNYFFNGPTVVHLMPGDNWNRVVNYGGESDQWEGFPRDDGNHNVKITAVLDQASNEFNDPFLWIGHAKSKPVVLVLFSSKRMPKRN